MKKEEKIRIGNCDLESRYPLPSSTRYLDGISFFETELDKYYGYKIPSHIDQSSRPPLMKKQFCCELCSTCLDMDISGRNDELTLKCICITKHKELHPYDNIVECDNYEESGHSNIKEIIYD